MIEARTDSTETAALVADFLADGYVATAQPLPADDIALLVDAAELAAQESHPARASAYAEGSTPSGSRMPSNGEDRRRRRSR